MIKTISPYFNLVYILLFFIGGLFFNTIDERFSVAINLTAILSFIATNLELYKSDYSLYTLINEIQHKVLLSLFLPTFFNIVYFYRVQLINKFNIEMISIISVICLAFTFYMVLDYIRYEKEKYYKEGFDYNPVEKLNMWEVLGEKEA